MGLWMAIAPVVGNTTYGSGEATIAKGFLLLTAGIPMCVYPRGRQSREPLAVAAPIAPAPETGLVTPDLVGAGR
jgi:hypothetical protein